jgi:hypothetical protein
MDIVGKGRMEIDLLGAAEQTNADIVITARSTATHERTAAQRSASSHILRPVAVAPLRHYRGLSVVVDSRHLALGGLEVRQTRLDPGGSHAHFDEPV